MAKKSRRKQGPRKNAQGKKLSPEMLIYFKRLVAQGYTIDELYAKFKGQTGRTHCESLRRKFKAELDREAAQIGRERANNLINLAEVNLKNACVQINRINEAGGREVIRKQKITTKPNGDQIETVEVIEQPSRQLNSAMSLVLSGIDTLAKLCGIYRPDFDQQGGMKLNVLDIPVTSDSDIDAYERAIETGGIQGLIEERQRLEGKNDN